MRRISSNYPRWRIAPLVCAAAIMGAGALTTEAAQAGERRYSSPFWILPDAGPADPAPSAPQASLPSRRPSFDRYDEAAALEAVQVALTEVGDGSSYVWYRRGGRLSGIVQPTQSFIDTFGRVCRQLIVTLSSDGKSRRTGAIGCRRADGHWVIDG